MARSKGTAVKKGVADSAVTKLRKKRIFRQRWKSVIRAMQKRADPIIPYASFNKVVREISTNDNISGIISGVRFTRGALSALQCGAEDFITDVMKDANEVAVIIAKRSTVLPIDFQYAAGKHGHTA